MEQSETPAGVKQLIPHREPFLFVDKVVKISETKGVAEKTFAADDPVFAGHFPHFPVVPGVLICEFAFQTAAAWLGAKVAKGMGFPESSTGEGASSLAAVAATDNIASGLPMVTRIRDVQFREPAFPGDTLTAEVELEDQAGNAYRFSARVYKRERLVARLEFTCMIVDKFAGPTGESQR